MTKNMLVAVEIPEEGTQFYYIEDLGTEFARQLAACHNAFLPDYLFNKIKHKKMVFDCPKSILASLIVVCER